MSTHPNAMLILELVPDDMTRATFRAIAEEHGSPIDDGDANITIGKSNYNMFVMESDYNESWQLSASEGSIVVFDYLTYGYGDTREWEMVVQQQAELKKWAEKVCAKHHCSAKYFISANYW